MSMTEPSRKPIIPTFIFLTSPPQPGRFKISKNSLALHLWLSRKPVTQSMTSTCFAPWSRMKSFGDHPICSRSATPVRVKVSPQAQIVRNWLQETSQEAMVAEVELWGKMVVGWVEHLEPYQYGAPLQLLLITRTYVVRKMFSIRDIVLLKSSGLKLVSGLKSSWRC